MVKKQKVTENVLIIIPAFNEEANIGGVLDDLTKIVSRYKILVVDDCSLDRTRKVAQERGVRVISHSFNMGYGGALKTGFKYGCKKRFDAVVLMDGDGQHDASSVPHLLREWKRGHWDIIVGSRYLGGGKYKSSPGRRLGQLFFSWITSLIIGRGFTDPTSGFQILSQKAYLFLAKMDYPQDFPDTDILIFLNRLGFKICEIPVKMNPRAIGSSMHFGLTPLYYFYKMCFSIFIALIREKTSWKEH